MHGLAALTIIGSDALVMLAIAAGAVIGWWMAIPAAISAVGGIASLAKGGSSGGRAEIYRPQYSKVDYAGVDGGYLDQQRALQERQDGQDIRAGQADMLRQLASQASTPGGTFAEKVMQSRIDQARSDAYGQVQRAMGGRYDPALARLGMQQSNRGAGDIMAATNAQAAQERAQAMQAYMQGAQGVRQQDLQRMLGMENAMQDWQRLGLQDKAQLRQGETDYARIMAEQYMNASRVNAGSDAAQQQYWGNVGSGLLNASSGFLQTMGSQNKQGDNSSWDAAVDAAGAAGAAAGGSASSGGAWDPTSDVRAKKNIAGGGPAVDAFLEAMQPYTYDYRNQQRDGSGRRMGVMAQDMAQGGPVGEELVTTGRDGQLAIDGKKAIPALLASVARLNQRLEQQQPEGHMAFDRVAAMNGQPVAVFPRVRYSGHGYQRPLVEGNLTQQPAIDPELIRQYLASR